MELDPSLLLYVKRDKKAVDQDQQKHQNPQEHQAEPQDQQKHQKPQENQVEQYLSQQKLVLEQETSENNQLFSMPSLFPDQEEIFPSLPIPNTRCKGSAVTAALRKVKRKPHREPLEPLSEIECSTNNITNTRNIDCYKLRVDKPIMNGGDDNDNCQETFCDPFSPGYSE